MMLVPHNFGGWPRPWPSAWPVPHDPSGDPIRDGGQISIHIGVGRFGPVLSHEDSRVQGGAARFACPAARRGRTRLRHSQTIVATGKRAVSRVSFADRPPTRVYDADEMRVQYVDPFRSISHMNRSEP